MGRVTSEKNEDALEKNEDAFLRWQREQRKEKWKKRIFWGSLVVPIGMGLLLFPVFTQQAQVPETQVPEALVLVTQVQEISVPEGQVQEISVPEGQVQEIRSGTQVLEIRLPVALVPEELVLVTQVLEIWRPVTPVQEAQVAEETVEEEAQIPEGRVITIQPGKQMLEMRVRVKQVQETQVLRIWVPVKQLQEIPPETQVLVIWVPVKQLQEIQPETQVLVAQVPEIETPFYFITAISILYCAVPILAAQYIGKRKQVQLSREACIFAARDAAKDLERGNPVRASLCMDKLLLALSDLLQHKSIALGLTSVTPREYMHVTPGKIPRRAVRRAIQASEDTKDFQERLRDLAMRLHGNVDAGYLAAHPFLVWLDQTTKSYQEESKSFFEKRPTFRTIVVVLGPPIVAALSVIAIAVINAT